MNRAHNNSAKNQTIYIANDHAGFSLKTEIIQLLTNKISQKLNLNITIHDLGCHDKSSVDYPDYAALLSQEMKQDSENTEESTKGLLICGTATGMAITANRFPWIRASVYESSLKIVELACQKNHINVLCIGAHYSDLTHLEDALTIFLATPRSGDRHQRRVHKMSSITNK